MIIDGALAISAKTTLRINSSLSKNDAESGLSGLALLKAAADAAQSFAAQRSPSLASRLSSKIGGLDDG